MKLDRNVIHDGLNLLKAIEPHPPSVYIKPLDYLL